VSEAADVASPASASGDAKASPFGAARPIDTAAKEREIEEKRVAALKEKKEADDKSREEKRIAKEAAKAEKTEGETDDGTPTAEIAKKTDGLTLEEDSTQDTTDSKPKEAAQQKPADTGAWRRPAAGPKPPRSDVPRGPRGDGPPRGPRNDSNRGPGPRANGGAPQSGAAAEQEAAAPEEDGWSTVSKPKKNQRGGARGI
jgi:translation initiation factor 4B